MLRLLLFMHHIVLCTPYIALLLVSHTFAFYDRSHGAKGGNPSGASPTDVRRSTSVKWRGYYPSFGLRQVPMYLINAFVFYFEALLYVLLDCALSL
jgi:hypothetical protein